LEIPSSQKTSRKQRTNGARSDADFNVTIGPHFPHTARICEVAPHEINDIVFEFPIDRCVGDAVNNM
jgi:acetoacetate decarboxylase